MTKFLVTLPALALVAVLSSSAVADNSISEATLADMGLAGIEKISDSEAMAVRGMGYYGGGHGYREYEPSSLAFGVSYAGVKSDKHHTGAEAGTMDGFLAQGRYTAAGEHLSEAGFETTHTMTLDVPGVGSSTETTTKTLRVYAGGFSTSSSL